MMDKRLERQSALLGIGLMVVASLALTLGFACALPLPAFAAIAALLFGFGAGFGAVGAVWLTNQVVGFGVMHYPLDAVTFAWGGALGLLGLAALLAARAAHFAVGGRLGGVLAFLAAFAAYEGLLCGLDVGLGLDPATFVSPVVTRLFAINAASFGVLYAIAALWGRARRPVEGAPALRRV